MPKRWMILPTIIWMLFLFSFTLGLSSASGDTDFSVGWIERLPKIDYVWNSANPAVEGWPVAGQTVTWVAHVRNLGSSTASAVGYRWILDGKVVSSGQSSFDARSIQTFTFPWKWERKRHQLAFEVDSSNAISEPEERNNRLLIYTDALAVGFWVEQTFWDRIQDTLKRAGIGCSTFEDWMQRRVLQFNTMATLAKYPETPNGVLDRWRIDNIHLVPDGALPLSPVGPGSFGLDPRSYGVVFPDSNDRSIDMQWGFPAFTIDYFKDNDEWSLMYSSLVHELCHARYLIDVYAWDVSSQNDLVGIKPPPPSNIYGLFHVTPEQGIMHTSWGYIDRYSAIALNRIAGHRATVGNYNEPANIGSFLNDLPAQNRVLIVTPDGKTFPGHTVRLYRASGMKDLNWRSHVYHLKIDGKPDAQFTTDSQGAIQVGRNPFSNGKLISGINQINTLAIVELVDGQTSHWGYLESRVFNLAYWRGKTASATHKLVVDAPICPGPGLGPDRLLPHHESLVTTPNVYFEWPALPNQTYQLWYTVDGGKPVRIDVKALYSKGNITIPLRGSRVAWWLVYQNEYAPPECSVVRSSTYFFDLQVP